MKPLRSLVYHRNFLSVKFFRGSHLGTFLTKPLRSLVFHRYFLNVEFFRGLYLVHFDKTLEKFDPPSMFSECGIFQRSTLDTFFNETFEKFGFSSMFFIKCGHFQRFTLSICRWNPWGVWSFFDIFWVWNFSEVYTWYIFDETFEKFGLSSIFSKFGIFQRFTLGTFLMKPSRSLVYHRNLLSVKIFQRFTLRTFLTKPLRSLVFHRYFLNLEFFRGLYSVHFDETLVRFDFPSMFSECGIFQRSTLNTFLMKLLRSSDFHRCFLSVDIFRGSHLVYSDETLEEFGLSTIFSECGIFQKSTLSTFLMKPLRSLFFHRYFLSVEFFRGSHLVHFLTKPLRSLVFHAYFPEHFIWNSRGVWTSIDIF